MTSNWRSHPSRLLSQSVIPFFYYFFYYYIIILLELSLFNLLTHYILISAAPECTENICILMDTAGYVVWVDDFLDRYKVLGLYNIF